MNKNITSKIALVLLGFTILVGFMLLDPVTFANSSESVPASVTISSTCSLTANNTIPHTADIMPGHEATEIGNTNIIVNCNDGGGSAVYAVGYSGDTWRNTNMIDPVSSSTIPTGTGTSTSNWSMKLTTTTSPSPTIRSDASYDFTDYERVPNNYALVASFPSSTDGVNNSTLSATYRAYVNGAQVAGTYTGKVKYTLVHPGNADPPTAGEKIYMQDLTLSACPTNPTVVYDNRDELPYTVAKLEDGNCWMLDNLALDLTDSSIVNGMDEDNTNASDTTLAYLKGNSVRNPSLEPNGKYATSDLTYQEWTGSNSYSAPLLRTTSKDNTYSQDALSDDAKTWKFGIHYNFCAASAGSYCYGDGSSYGTSSGNADEDICPKGWRLPTGGSAGEYYALYSGNYGYNSFSSLRTALHLPLAGYVYDGAASENGQGSYGYYWSSTRSADNYMYYLDLHSSDVFPTESMYRDRGLSIRCILD